MAAVALSGNSADAALTIAPGDLLFGVYQVNSAGTGVTPNTYVYNLGAGSNYHEGGVGQGVLANIGADLTKLKRAPYKRNDPETKMDSPPWWRVQCD